MGSSWDDLGGRCAGAAVGGLGSLCFNPKREKARGSVLSERLPVKIRASNVWGFEKAYVGLGSDGIDVCN